MSSPCCRNRSILTDKRFGAHQLRFMLFSAVACLGYMAGSGRPVGLATRSCVSMKKTVEEAEPAERPEINIAMNSIVEFQVRAGLLDDTMQNN